MFRGVSLLLLLLLLLLLPMLLLLLLLLLPIMLLPIMLLPIMLLLLPPPPLASCFRITHAANLCGSDTLR